MFKAFIIAALFGVVTTNTFAAPAASVVGAPEPAPGAQSAAVRKVVYDAATGMLGVEVVDADLGGLLGRIAQMSGLTIELGAGISKKVSVTFTGLPLEQGINAIVGAAGESNLVAEYTKKPGDQGSAFRLEKIVLLRKGQEAGATAKAGGAGVPAQRRAALGELLQQYEDPKTTRDEKQELRRTIRRGARTPQEKAQLMQAVLDPRHQGQIAEDLQFALLQSMREHPEGSDSAYVVGLLKRESSPGPLVRAMVGSGDPASVRYLVSAAQAQDIRAIELIGNLRVTQAVPLLEQMAASPGNAPATREAAENALRQLGVATTDRGGAVRVSEESAE